MSQDTNIYALDAAGFEKHVVEESRRRLVIVDFWADWCAPCRQLGPVLEELTQSYDGRVALAKVDVDKNRELAMRYNVRGIPAVKIFRDGSVAGEFTGALPRPEVERIIQGILPTAADELVREGDDLLEQGETQAAAKRFQRALEQDERHAGALVRLGELALEEGDTRKALDLLSRVEEDAGEYESAQGALARIEFAETCRQAGGLEACRRREEEDPENAEFHYNLGCCLAARGEHQAALAEFLQVLQIDREYQEQAARTAMLRIFSLVGPQSELAQQYRRKLAAALY